MKKGDFVLMTVFGVLLVFVIAIFVFRPKAVNCVVYENRNEIASFPLNEDVVYTIRTSDGHENVLQIKDGKARVISADCPNQICVHTSPISKVGESILCLPHKISIALESARK